MLLAIDVGNSNIAFGVNEGGKWLDRWRIRTAPDKMPDEYSVLFRSLLGTANVEMRSIDRFVLSSVVPSLTGTIGTMITRETGEQPLVVGLGIELGIRLRTDNPGEVGTDLLANAVAAFERFKQSCIVVDFGTALTFTAVDAQAELVGVTIAPGLRYAVQALAEHTAQLPQVQLVAPPTAIGRNTIHAIQAGVIYGYVGLVESLIDRIGRELRGDTKVVAIGGQSQVIAPLTKKFDLIEPWLTLEGLRIVADKNEKP